MIRKKALLDSVRIATPCPARWSEMEGDDRKRYCNLCKLNVYDVSQMTKDDAEKLIRESSGRLCMRLHQRADGRIITKDCPVGQSAMRKRLVMIAVTGAALILASIGKAASLKRSELTPAESDFGQLYAKAKNHLQECGFLKKAPVPATPPIATTGVVATLGRAAMPLPTTKATPHKP